MKKKKNNKNLEIRKHRAAIVLGTLKKLLPRAGVMLRYKNNWELLVAVELSAQCTDKKVNEVTEKLFKKYKTLDSYVRAKQRDFFDRILSKQGKKYSCGCKND